MNLDLVRNWLKAKDRVEKAEDRVKGLKAERNALELDVIAEYEREGIQNLKIGTRTVYLHRSLRARPKAGEREDLVAALMAEGLGDLVKEDVNTNTLAAYVRERENEGDELPTAVAAHIAVEEMFSIRAVNR